MLLAPALLMARDADSPAPPKRGISAASLLPPGSLLSGVLLPRYDENRRLVGVLRAKSMTLVTAEILDGVAVSIELFNPDRSPRARIDLVKAQFDQIKGTLHAEETVTMSFDSISATGRGLIYEFDQAQGILLGPTTTRIKPPPATTTMKRSESPRRVAAVVGASLIAAPLAIAAVEPAAVSPAAAASAAPAASAANAQVRSDLRAALSASAEATRAATAFLEQEEVIAKDPPSAAVPVQQARALDVKPGPDDTVINCDGGMYFDSDKGLLVYLKNVTVADPRFSLDGANEIQVFFERKPDAPKPEPKPGDKPVPGGFNAKIGDAERVVATGAVHILKKPDAGDAKKETIEAAGAIFSYNVKTGEIVLSGGKPWIRKIGKDGQGGLITRAKQSNQTIRVINGEFTFSGGGSETIVTLPAEQLKRK
ncbi:MAG: hypothetical protein WCK77_07205 [Verrucomicrobiota bacterium]